MIATIMPSAVQGQVTAPASKSVAQRALAAALIRRGTTVLHNIGFSADEQAVLTLLEQIGCILSITGNTVSIDSTNVRMEEISTVHFGESGLASRMFIPLLALQSQEIRLNGSGTLLRRPMHFLETVLPPLGVSITTTNGTLPATIRGPLVPATITVDGSISSQFITGLIMAYTAAQAAGCSIHVANAVSTPYLDLTLKVMDDMGLPVPVYEAATTSFHFQQKTIPPTPRAYTIEGDWSSAAFLLVAGAIGGHVAVTGLDLFTTQGDKAVLQALMGAGAQLSITMEAVEIHRSSLRAFQFNATDCPDLFPPLAVLAAFAHGTSVIEGVHRLQHKESNRALTLQEELGKMGIAITLQDDLMIIKGGQVVNGALVDARDDHRIAMACAVAALGAIGTTTLQGAGAIEKSYPQFFRDLQSLGANVLIS